MGGESLAPAFIPILLGPSDTSLSSMKGLKAPCLFKSERVL